MTRERVAKARNNKDKNAYDHVDFRLGEIENLPIADNSVNVIISNCIINLSLDKQRVFDEAFRALKIGDLELLLKNSGFKNINIIPKTESKKVLVLFLDQKETLSKCLFCLNPNKISRTKSNCGFICLQR